MKNVYISIAIILVFLAMCLADNLMAQSGANMHFIWDSAADSVTTKAQDEAIYETSGHVQWMCQGIHTNTNKEFPNAEPFVNIHVRLDEAIDYYTVSADSVEDYRDGITIWAYDSIINEEKVLRLLYYALTNYSALLKHRRDNMMNGGTSGHETTDTVDRILAGPCPSEVTKNMKTLLR